MGMLDYTITRSDSPTSAEDLSDILANPGFGKHFTDHMVTIDWTEGKGVARCSGAPVRSDEHGPGQQRIPLWPGDL